MKRIMIFTAFLAAVVMYGIAFSGCYTYFTSLRENEPDDPWAERWSGWYAQDLERAFEPVYTNTVIVNRYWHSTDIHSFHRNVYDWYHGCWVLEPEFRISIGWTDGWFDWDFGWDWAWDREYRPVFWHPPFWAFRAWNSPMAHCGWWRYSVWPHQDWYGWRHSTAYAYDYPRHQDWMNPPVVYPDQPRIQNRRTFESRRGTDLRRGDRIETATWNAPAGKDLRRRRTFVERAERDQDARRPADSNRRSVQNNSRTDGQIVRREYRNSDPLLAIQPRTPNPEARSPRPESRFTPHASRLTAPESRPPKPESRITPHASRLTAPEARSTMPEARSARRRR